MADTPDLLAPQPAPTPAPSGATGTPDLLAPQRKAKPQQAQTPTPASPNFYSQGAAATKTPPHHSFLEELGGVEDLPFEAGDAMVEGRLSGHGEFSMLHKIFQTDPATADDLFGNNAKPFLQYVVQHAPNTDEGRKAQELLKNPLKAGIETFILEMVNPFNTITGKGLSAGGGLLHGFLSQSERGRQFLNLFSPFRNIAKVAGDKGKAALGAIINGVRFADDAAMHETQRVFGGLTEHEARDVVRRMQHGKVVPGGYGAPQLQSGVQRLPGEGSGEAEAMHNPNRVFVPGPGRIHPQIAQAKNLDLRAKQLNELLRSTTQKRVAEGTLPKSSVFNQQGYFPMRGAYRDPNLNQDEFDFIESLRGGNRGAGTYTLPPNYQKTFFDIDQAEQSGLLRDDASMANQLYRHLSRSNQNLAANRGIANLPESLIRRPDQTSVAQQASARLIPDLVETRGGKTLPGQFTQPALRPPEAPNFKLVGTQLANKEHLPANPEEDIYRAFYEQRPGLKTGAEKPPEGWVRAEEVFPGTRLLPALQGAWLKREFAEWLRDHGGSQLTGQPIKLFGSEGFAQWVDRYNTAMRQAVIANPAYHLLWNIAWNGSAAMGSSPVFLVGNTARAVLGTLKSMPGIGKPLQALASKIGDNAIYSRFMGSTQQWNEDVMDAIRAGATAEFGATHSVLGGHAADLFTKPWSDLSFAGKIDKFFTSATDWNKRAVFGPNGEQAFATRLFTRLTKRGYDKSDAAIMTREALGNYQNVDPQNILSQLFFFYPWLKGNTAFWTKAFLTNPAYTVGPLEGIRRHNQLANDPNFTGRYPTPDLTIYQGQNKEGQGQYLTPPLPQRTAAQLVNSAATGDPFEMAFTASNIAGSHANPVVGNAISALATVMAQRKEGLDPATGSNYDIVFNKDAPRAEQFKEIGGFLVSHDIPVPLVQYAIQDAVRQGWSPQKLKDEIVQSAGLGFPHNRPSQQQSKQINAAYRRFEMVVHNTQKQATNGAITGAQAQARIQRAFDLYKKRRNALINPGQQPASSSGNFYGGTP